MKYTQKEIENITVGELIEVLKTLDQSAIVCVGDLYEAESMEYFGLEMLIEYEEQEYNLNGEGKKKGKIVHIF